MIMNIKLTLCPFGIGLFSPGLSKAPEDSGGTTNLKHVKEDMCISYYFSFSPSSLSQKGAKGYVICFSYYYLVDIAKICVLVLIICLCLCAVMYVEPEEA